VIRWTCDRVRSAAPAATEGVGVSAQDVGRGAVSGSFGSCGRIC